MQANNITCTRQVVDKTIFRYCKDLEENNVIGVVTVKEHLLIVISYICNACKQNTNTWITNLAKRQPNKKRPTTARYKTYCQFCRRQTN